jgi:ribose 5-phosphate isomerase B
MAEKRIALANDHAGLALKAVLRRELDNLGYEVLDLGTNSTESVDYPDFGRAMAETIAAGRAPRGIVICGSGIGISIACNRNPKVRAALCHDVTTAQVARQHNDANVLALGARTTGEAVALDCLRAFLATEFEGGRHARRVAKL